MKCVIQRVRESHVEIDGKVISRIQKGLNLLLGIEAGDMKEDVNKLVSKIIALRVFGDELGKMNLSIQDIDGEALVISQFTLAASLRKGRRPSFDNAEKPEQANRLYELFVSKLSEHVKVQTGEFAADMKVFIVNDGPVTFILDSKELS
ncbi:MAG: D-aminoacyl-tRNA deacylase [Candidatus Margulisiibacteriota bacterium]